MLRPNSEVQRLRSSTSTAKPPLLSNTASSTRRQFFDISPGQVCSVRDEPLISRIPEAPLPPHAEPDNSARSGTMHAGALQGRASTVLANRGDRNFIGFAGECLTVCVE